MKTRLFTVCMAAAGWWLTTMAHGAGPTFPFYFEVHPAGPESRELFKVRGAAYDALVSPEGVRIAVPTTPQGSALGASGLGSSESGEIHFRWVGAQTTARLNAEDLLAGKVNYLSGTQNKVGLATCRRVCGPELYPGIDIVYYGNQRQLECDLIVAPGADPEIIGLEWEGADSLELDDHGDLVLPVAGGGLRLCRPVVYQVRGAERRAVKGQYRLDRTARRIHFELEPYNRALPLVIDPIVVYDRLEGGTALEYPSSLATDSDGNVYVAGYTLSGNFRVVNAAQPAKGAPPGDPDAFVLKLDPSGRSLIYATYLGGTRGQVASGIAVDNARNAWVAGWTGSTDFPTRDPLQPEHRGGTNDVFVVKLSANGSELLFGTLLGGTGSEFCAGIALDGAGNPYLTGTTGSADFPVLQPAQNTYGGFSDAFVAKLDASATRWIFSTFLGGNETDFGTAIAVNPAGNAVVTGVTTSTDFPLIQPLQGTRQGTTDVFVVRFNLTGQMEFGTLLGGHGDDFSTGVALGPGDDVWLTGATFSEDFPVLNAFQPVFRGGNCQAVGQAVPCIDAFVTRLAADGRRLVFSTYFGGSSVENLTAPLTALLFHSQAISVDARGFAYVTGMTSSRDFPIVNPVQDELDGDSDAFLAKIHPLGPLVYSTFLGGPRNDYGTAIHADTDGNVFLAGWRTLPTIGGTQNDLTLARIYELPVTAEVPSGALHFSVPRMESTEQFQANLTVPPGSPFVVEATENFLQWIAVTNR